MINRELIRLKIVQLVYAYYQNEGKALDVALKELDFSIDKGYELYHFMLALLVEVREYCERKDDARKLREERAGLVSDEVSAYQRLAQNQFLLQLADNLELKEYRANKKKAWEEEESHVKRLATAFAESEITEAYLKAGQFDYNDDRELVRKLYKTFISGSEDLDGMLEEHSLYWNHDKDVVDSFVLKTIKRFDSANGEEQQLLPQFSDPDDRFFAHKLFEETVKRGEEIRQLIRENSKNWEFSRLAFMDVIIMQIALAEIFSFPSVPLSVSFNEYLNIAKMYSTPKSSSYINGLLDHVCKKQREEGKLLKERPETRRPSTPKQTTKK